MEEYYDKGNDSRLEKNHQESRLKEVIDPLERIIADGMLLFSKLLKDQNTNLSSVNLTGHDEKKEIEGLTLPTAASLIFKAIPHGAIKPEKLQNAILQFALSKNFQDARKGFGIPSSLSQKGNNGLAHHESLALGLMVGLLQTIEKEHAKAVHLSFQEQKLVKWCKRFMDDRASSIIDETTHKDAVKTLSTKLFSDALHALYTPYKGISPDSDKHIAKHVERFDIGHKKLKPLAETVYEALAKDTKLFAKLVINPEQFFTAAAKAIQESLVFKNPAKGEGLRVIKLETFASNYNKNTAAVLEQAPLELKKLFDKVAEKYKQLIQLQKPDFSNLINVNSPSIEAKAFPKPISIDSIVPPTPLIPVKWTRDSLQKASERFSTYHQSPIIKKDTSSQTQDTEDKDLTAALDLVTFLKAAGKILSSEADKSLVPGIIKKTIRDESLDEKESDLIMRESALGDGVTRLGKLLEGKPQDFIDQLSKKAFSQQSRDSF